MTTPTTKEFPVDDYLANVEADRRNEGEPRNQTSVIRRKFFAGERLSAQLVAEEIGCSNGLLNMTVRDMEALGFNFDKETVPSPNGLKHTRTFHVLRNPAHRVTAESVRAVRALHMGARNGKGKTKRKRGKPTAPTSPEVMGALGMGSPEPERPRRGRKPARVPVPPLPEMGATLTVAMLAVDPDTNVARIGLRNGVHAYEVTVESWSVTTR